MNVAPYQGSVVIDNISDAIEAIEAKLGIGASVAAANQVLRGTGAGSSAFGALQTGDIAAAATTSASQASGATSSPTTSSSTLSDLAEMTLTPTLVGGGFCLVVFECTFSNNTVGGNTSFTLLVGGSSVKTRDGVALTANERNQVIIWHLFTSTASSPVVKVQWQVGTAGHVGTAVGTQRSLTVFEFKR